jgi:LPXTG-site transpeptidase (sortase) family protein
VSNFSNSSDTQFHRLVQAKIWQIVGIVLIGGGVMVMIWAGWMFYQQQTELTNPPAPIVDSSAIEPAAPPTTQPEPTPSPTITPTGTANAQAGQVIPSPALQLEPTTTPVIEPVSAPAIDELMPTAAIRASVPDEETLVFQETINENIPSLADNPLLVAEDLSQTETAGDTATRVATSPPTRIVASSINLDTSVVETGWVQIEKEGVTTNVWVVADYAAGWHKNSALPGQGGNVVLSGHHNIKGEVFRDIVELEVGDTVSVFVNNQQYDYAVSDKFIVKDKGEPDSVRQANAKWIGPFNEERLTLVTCWPYTNNTHRVIVIARPL